MGLPQTFMGILGFMILSGYLIMDVMDNNASSNSATSGIYDLQQTMNQTLNDQESSGGFSGFFNMLGSIITFAWSIILLALTAVLSFLKIPLMRGLPQEMYVIFSIVVLSLIAASVKWIWSGER